uniref:CSON009947 protein n=1 Tax=Culicoides sonorensis TaxID=179676 RepID=A0A336LKG8_CULSO
MLLDLMNSPRLLKDLLLLSVPMHVHMTDRSFILRSDGENAQCGQYTFSTKGFWSRLATFTMNKMFISDDVKQISVTFHYLDPLCPQFPRSLELRPPNHHIARSSKSKSSSNAATTSGSQSGRGPLLGIARLNKPSSSSNSDAKTDDAGSSFDLEALLGPGTDPSAATKTC